MSPAFDIINRNDLMQELETFYDENECRTARLLLNNTTINIQFGDISGNDVKTSVDLRKVMQFVEPSSTLL